jgi:hypothetical protein
MMVMRRQPVESDFEVEILKTTIAVRFWPTRSLYTFARFISAREIAEFGPVSPDPDIQHASRSSGTRNYDAAEVLAMAFQLATEAAGRG